MEESKEICPLRFLMDMIGGKWKLNLICVLKEGKPMRYNQLKRAIPGITNVMLAQSLKSLEEYGILFRTQYNEVPVRVEYQLTENGFHLIRLLEMLSDWGNKYMEQFNHVESYCTCCEFYDKDNSIDNMKS